MYTSCHTLALHDALPISGGLGVDIPIRTVTATRGKVVRAQPVAALAAQGRWHMAGVFEELEDQLATWYPELGWSPDRLDAMVWPAWQLKLVGTASRGQGDRKSTRLNSSH